MKSIFFASIMIFSTSVWANCNRPVDPNKVIFFVDTNFSDLEINTAQAGACARGETLVIVPNNYRDYTRLIRAQEAATRPVMNCGTNCEAASARLVSAIEAIDAFRSSQPSIDDSIRAELTKLRERGAKISNFTISGHDGGGMFGGHKGGTSRPQLLEIMNEFQDVNEAQSVLLLGCYTGVQNEIVGWKQIFPKARLIGGYDGSAPLSDRPAGHEYLSDLLTKEHQLIREANQSRLDSQVRSGIRSINAMNTALWINPLCADGTTENELELYYSSSSGRRLSPFEINACTNKSAELTALSQEYEKYLSGELEPPTDTANGALRRLYSRARTDEHCSEQLNINFDANKLLFLLFNEGTEKNFGMFYQEDLATAESILNSITPESMKAQLDSELAETNTRIADNRRKFEELADKESMEGVLLTKEISRDEEAASKILQRIGEYTLSPEKIRSLWIPTTQNLGRKTRGELMRNTHALNELLTGGGLTVEQRRALGWVNNRVSNHLEKFNNPFEWHEFTGFPVTPQGAIRLADFQVGKAKKESRIVE